MTPSIGELTNDLWNKLIRDATPEVRREIHSVIGGRMFRPLTDHEWVDLYNQLRAYEERLTR